MSVMQYASVNDTIVAISSAPGGAARGIVRLSGPDAATIAAGLFRGAGGEDVESAAGFTSSEGVVTVSGRHVVPATLYFFRAPRSYTRQDTIEIHTVGSPPVLDMIVERCTAAGARLASPGEFTARAFLAGAMNLPEAEAVAAAIRATSDGQLRAARRMMSGHLSDEILRWREQLAELCALVEADIDFAEEPIDFISAGELAQRVERLRGGIDALIRSAARAERLDTLPHVLLLGAPNAGKSTLFNALTGFDRAIASAVAGTTRDILAEPVRVGRSEIMLLDGAGIDDDPDEILRHARQRALDAAAHVDLVCLVVDASNPVDTHSVRSLKASAGAATLILAAKSDAADPVEIRERCCRLSETGCGEVLVVSALTGTGLDELRTHIRGKLFDDGTAAEPAGTVLSARQRESLAQADAALRRCTETARETDSVLDVAELLAADLRDALDALAAITGAVTTEDILGRIFASFCIGK